jgi:hypothetical protein
LCEQYRSLSSSYCSFHHYIIRRLITVIEL